MTTLHEIEVRCAVCGSLSRRAVLSSTSSFGPPDLDLRPQGPARWALEFEIQRCEACGYCAPSLGQAPVGARETVESTVYSEVLERSRLPRLARSYFCAALVSEAAGALEESAWRFLQAAWACDDKDARDAARICRERAAEMFGRALTEAATEAHDEVVLTLSADVWRRAGRFENAIATAERVERLAEQSDGQEDTAVAAVVAAFIRGLAEAGDDALHNSSEAFVERD